MTNRTRTFGSVNANVGSWSTVAPAAIKQLSYQVKVRLISQIISGISIIFQTLPRYFNGTIISTCFALYLPV